MKHFLNLFKFRILYLTFIFATPVNAWSPLGNEIIARIAQNHLSPSAKMKIQKILGVGNNLLSICNWADEIRSDRPETSNWHMIALPYRKNISLGDIGEYCPNGNCLVNQITLDETILRNSSATKNQKKEALEFLVNLMGDLHQPLHCSDDGDHGGNDKLVLFQPLWTDSQGRRQIIKINLCLLWDDLISPNLKEDPLKLTKSIERMVSPKEKEEWAKGTERDWAYESYKIAKVHIYAGLDWGPRDYSDHALPKNYFYQMRPLACLQLCKAGIRLSYVLNNIFK